MGCGRQSNEGCECACTHGWGHGGGHCEREMTAPRTRPVKEQGLQGMVCQNLHEQFALGAMCAHLCERLDAWELQMTS